MLAVLLMAGALTACGSKAEDLPDLSGMGEVTVVSREDGSGTKAQFEQTIASYGDGTDTIALSTQEVVSLVSEDPNAIGYAAWSAIEDTDQVKFLSIDGVEPTAETIGNGKYPLTRNYYLAYMGQPSAVETDFLAYVMSAGQELAGQSGIAVKKATSFLSDGSSGTITVEGSTSVAPLMQALADGYHEYNPNATISVKATDSTSGLTAAIRGECDLAMSSRTLKDYEKELLEVKTIALDGIAVLVNSENPLENLSIEQLKKLYDGDVQAWTDLAK